MSAVDIETKPSRAEILKAAHERRKLVARLIVRGWGATRVQRYLARTHQIVVCRQTIDEDIAYVREAWLSAPDRLNTIELVAEALGRAEMLSEEWIGRALDGDPEAMRGMIGLLRLIVDIAEGRTTTSRTFTAKFSMQSSDGTQVELEASLSEDERFSRAKRIAAFMAAAGALPGVRADDDGANEPPEWFAELVERTGGPAGELGGVDDAALDGVHTVRPD